MPHKKNFYTKYSNEKVKVSEKAFASGGEGALYAISSPRSMKHLVAKLYYTDKRTPEREEKMTYLVQHPPRVFPLKDPSMAWVVDILYLDQKFVGIIMPKIKGKKLTKLCFAKLPRRSKKDWQRFAFGSTDALKLRLKTCFNLATTIHQLHQVDQYALVDLKPDNVLMQSNGLLALVDLDSVQVVEYGQKLFSAPVATPEYTPPEYYKTIDNDTILHSWDHFSMAVIFYQLLFGLHPFAASAKEPYDKLTGLDDKIKHGLFVHHTERQAIFKVIPPPHAQFQHLPASLKTLFLECFELGEKFPEQRPSAAAWCIALADVLDLKLALPNILGPNTLNIKPSKHFKLPAALFDEKELEIKLEPLTLEQTFDSLILPDNLSSIDIFGIQQKALKQYKTLFDRKKAKIQAGEEKIHNEAVQFYKEKKQFYKKEVLDQKNKAFLLKIILVLVVFLSFSMGAKALLGTLPILLALFLISGEVLRIQTEADKHSPPIPLESSDIEDKALPIDLVLELGYTRSNLDQSIFLEEEQTKKYKLVLDKKHQALLDLKKELSQHPTSYYETLIQQVEDSTLAYEKSLTNFKQQILQYFQTANKLQHSEVPSIVTALNELVQSSYFKPYEAKNFMHLKQFLEYPSILLKQQLTPLNSKNEQLRIRQKFQQQRKQLIVATTLEADSIKSVQKNELLPLEQELETLASTKSDQYLKSNLLKGRASKRTKLIESNTFLVAVRPYVLLRHEVLDLEKKVAKDLQIIFESTANAIENSFHTDYESYTKSDLLETFSKLPSPYIKETITNDFDLDYLKDVLGYLKSFEEELIISANNLNDKIIQFSFDVNNNSSNATMKKLESLFYIRKIFEASYLEYLECLNTIYANQSIASFKEFALPDKEQKPLKEQLHEFDEETNSLREIQENALEKTQTEKELLLKEKRPLIKKRILANKINFEETLKAINLEHAELLHSMQDNLVKKRIKAYSLQERAPDDLLIFQEKYTQIIEEKRTEAKQAHLELQETLCGDFDALLKKRQELMLLYDNNKKILQEYSQKVTQVEQLHKDYEEPHLLYQEQLKEKIILETLRVWLNSFDDKIPIEEVLEEKVLLTQPLLVKDKPE